MVLMVTLSAEPEPEEPDDGDTIPDEEDDEVPEGDE